VGQSWWNFGENVRGRVGGIVEKMCRVELVELWR